MYEVRYNENCLIVNKDQLAFILEMALKLGQTVDITEIH